MAKPRARTGKRFSRKGLVPMTFEITPELKAKLARRAKQMGMSFTELASLLIERAVLQKKSEEDRN
jgi:hypothetical protein